MTSHRSISVAVILAFLGMVELASAAVTGPELHISSSGEVYIIGAELASRHAINLFTLDVWGQKWTVSVDRFTAVEDAAGTKIDVEQIITGHKLEIKGRPMAEKVGWVDAKLVRDLSIGTPVVSRVEPPPPAAPSPAAISAALTPTPTPAPTLPPAATSPTAVPPSTSPSKRILTQQLRLGMRGREVVILQEFFQKNNWGIPNDGPVTGYYGKVTVNAVKKFQIANGLPPEGEVGPKTRALINEFLNK